MRGRDGRRWVAALVTVAVLATLAVPRAGAAFAARTANGAASTWQSAVSFRGMYVWGDNNASRLGLGDTVNRTRPVLLLGAWRPAADSIGAGGNHACAVRIDGTLWCWGDNSFGRLGTNDTVARTTPTRVGTDTDWVTVGSGWGFNCALKSTGTAWCWGGANSYGQLGLGDKVDRWVPTQVGTDVWRKLTVGEHHVCGIRTDGSLWCWGGGNTLQLGFSTYGDVWAPAHAPALDGSWYAVSAGTANTCGIKADRGLWCWGANGSYEMGLGTNDGNHPSPEQIFTTSPQVTAADGQWQQVSVGDSTSCAVRTNGTLWCWGGNLAGEAGRSPVPVPVPTRVGADTDWAEVEVYHHFTCARKVSNAVYCWGANTSGQLGLGDTVDRSTPTRVPDVEALALAAGTGSDSSYVVRPFP